MSYWMILRRGTSYVEPGAEKRADFYANDKFEIVNPRYVKVLSGNDFAQLVPDFVYDLIEKTWESDMYKVIDDIKDYISGDPPQYPSGLPDLTQGKYGEIWSTTYKTYNKTGENVQVSYNYSIIRGEINRIKGILGQKKEEIKEDKPRGRPKGKVITDGVDDTNEG